MFNHENLFFTRFNTNSPNSTFSLWRDVRSTSYITNPESISPAFAGLHDLPYAIRSDLENAQLECGVFSSALKFFEKLIIDDVSYARNIIQNIFYDAVRQNRHLVAYNMIVILSELPYSYLGEWASIMAEAALKTSYADVAEVGIRCFENWEDKEACKRLRNFDFKHDWLREYADEVCLYVDEEGTESTPSSYNWGSEHERVKRDNNQPFSFAVNL